MALWKGQCGCTGLRCLTCSDGLDKVSGQTAESGRQETDNTLIERGESRRKCLLRKIQWVSQKIKNKNLMWVLVIDRIGIKKFEFQTIHSDRSVSLNAIALVYIILYSVTLGLRTPSNNSMRYLDCIPPPRTNVHKAVLFHYKRYN